MSLIQWTQETWNPVVGCTLKDKECISCYAMVQAEWLSHIGTTREKYKALTIATKAGPVWNGKLRFWEPDLCTPLTWKRPRLVFPCSMSDIAHEDMLIEWFGQIWRVMIAAHKSRGHIFQVLTKRPKNLLRLLAAIGVTSPEPGIWLGVSAGNTRFWLERVPVLREFPTDIRWVSAEPQLKRIRPDLKGVDWVVQGGESKQRKKPARPFDLDWARLMHEACRDAGVPYFLKQVGGAALDAGTRYRTKHSHGGDPEEWPDDLRVREWPR